MPDARITKLLALGTVLAAPLAFAPAAPAAAPAPCNGMFQTDAAGDAEYDSNGLLPGGGKPGTPNMEVTGVYFNTTAGKTTMNIVLKNLDKTRPPSSETGASGGIWYYGYYTYKDQVHFVRAAQQSSGVTYAHGTVDEEGIYHTTAATEGSFNEGPDGVVSVLIPAAAGGKVGETLGKFFATSETIEGRDDFVGINHQADWTPTADGEDADILSPNGFDYTVAECAAAPAPPAGTPDVPAAPPAQQAPAPGPSQPAAKPTSLGLKFPASLGSAKKARKGLSFKVSAAKAVSNLKLTLKDKKGKSVASATIASLKAGTSTIKMKARKLKAGRYTLVAAGSVDGTALSSTHAVSLKK